MWVNEVPVSRYPLRVTPSGSLSEMSRGDAWDVTRRSGPGPTADDLLEVGVYRYEHRVVDGRKKRTRSTETRWEVSCFSPDQTRGPLDSGSGLRRLTETLKICSETERERERESEELSFYLGFRPSQFVPPRKLTKCVHSLDPFSTGFKTGPGSQDRGVRRGWWSEHRLGRGSTHTVVRGVGNNGGGDPRGPVMSLEDFRGV